MAEEVAEEDEYEDEEEAGQWGAAAEKVAEENAAQCQAAVEEEAAEEAADEETAAAEQMTDALVDCYVDTDCHLETEITKFEAFSKPVKKAAEAAVRRWAGNNLFREKKFSEVRPGV